MTRYKHVVEIGAGDSYSTEGLRWATHADKVTLFEPNIILRKELQHAAQGLSNVIVRGEAVTAMGGKWDLVHLGYASYLADYPSFFNTSIEEEGRPFLKPLMRLVDLVDSDTAVPSDADVLYLTCNGVERLVLLGMSNRPKTIYTKHYLHNAKQWTEAQQVMEWMRRNGYLGVTLETNQHNTFYSLRWERA